MTLRPLRSPRAARGRRARLAAAALTFSVVLPLAAQERLTFIGVALDPSTRDADHKLQDYLYRTAGVRFAPEELEYARVIDRLSNWRPEEGPFLARTTPFVYVAAEMLGAELELLATYVSETTGRRVYHSYLVVRREDFPEPPTLPEAIDFLARRAASGAGRARFIYHSEFSTSSFFLPSLYFRSNRVYHMEESTESLIAIASRPIEENSSTRLVEQVADGAADLAAVWDGTLDKFAADGEADERWQRFGRRVHFVRLPTALPNDLLVCSASLDDGIKERLRAAVGNLGERGIGVGDFRTWESIRAAPDARAALAELRWLAHQRPAPITVEVRLGPPQAGPPQAGPRPAGRRQAGSRQAGPRQAGGDRRPAVPLAEAARQAVRLSGSELVVYDPDFHEQIDFVWTLEAIHDGAAVLTSALPGSGVADQVFRLSFADTEDLVRRLVDVIHSRLHRIRYAWPYSADPLIVIRDLADSIDDGAAARVQRIHWIDPERNHFRAGPLFDAAVRRAGFYRYELEVDPAAAVKADALSNVSYRVLLLRAPRERLLFRVMTVALVALLAAAALAALAAVRGPRSGAPRSGVPRSGAPASPEDGSAAGSGGSP